MQAADRLAARTTPRTDHRSGTGSGDAAAWSLIDAVNAVRWDAAVAECGLFDAYHLAGYHRAAEHIAPGTRGLLFHYRDRDCAAAVPMMVRPLPEGVGAEFAALSDAVSAYGYPGPLCSAACESEAPAGFAVGFQAALKRALRERSVLSFFLRHNPLIDTAWLTAGLGGQTVLGPTVAIDLSKSLEDQRLEISKRHRNDYRKALERGVCVVEDRAFDRLDTFVELYNATMAGLDAQDFYFFDIAYYRDLKACLGDRVSLFHVMWEGRIVGSTIVFLTNGIIQYHLGGWARDAGKLSPLRIVLEHLRHWGHERGYRWVHIGGGVGAGSDSLLRFKRGFSKTEFSYLVSRIVMDEDIYVKACRAAGHIPTGASNGPERYFPLYREPPRNSDEEGSDAEGGVA